MKVLDLFSGIGGFSLGLERAGMDTLAFCEIEEYPQKVLKKHWPDVPLFEDVRELTKEKIEDATGYVPELICGGYPCQPFSVAGKQRGAEDDRHLWPEVYRLIKSIKPRWVVCENVAGHINLGLDEVLASLEAEGYTWWAFVIPACAVDGYHRRDRVWIVANSNDSGGGASGSRVDNDWSKEEQGRGKQSLSQSSGFGEAVANSNDKRLQRCKNTGSPCVSWAGRNEQPWGCDQCDCWEVGEIESARS